MLRACLLRTMQAHAVGTQVGPPRCLWVLVAGPPVLAPPTAGTILRDPPTLLPPAHLLHAYA